MDYGDHVGLLREGVRGGGNTWADLGSGEGAFTVALADLLGPRGSIYAVDRDSRAMRVQARRLRDAFPNVTVTPPVADFARPIEVPPLDGIVMTNDRYVHHPARLQVLAACIRVTAGSHSSAPTPMATYTWASPSTLLYVHLVVAANSGVERGDLVIEPISESRVTQADAIATCAADRDPLRALPTLGEHVWMEGRFFADLDNGGWRELHPLYRWGPLP